MESIFQNVLEMGFYGSIAIIAVLILRKLFNRIPKRIICLFWIVPVFRLLCPLNFNTIFSVMNVAKLSLKSDKTVGNITDNMTAANLPATGIKALPKAVDLAGSHNGSTVNLLAMLGYLWFAGMLLMFLYLAVKTLKLQRMLASAKKVPNKKYYKSDEIDTSFVLGILKPRIYMQSGLSPKEESYILLHESTHIRYRDHITRIVGVLTICVHWFNPLVWIAFSKMCADLEMRCDETVVERMGQKIKMEYCKTMVRHAMERGVEHRGLSVAFSGDNCSGKEIKMRIKNLINYKKVSKISAVLVIIFALSLTIVLSTKAKSETKTATTTEVETEKVGEAVSVPGNIPVDMTDEECLENYGKEELEIPDDVVYSDEGRPYSKTYDYKTSPTLSRLAGIVENAGYVVLDPDVEYLDQDGNTQVGRELYCFNAEREDGSNYMMLSLYMVSEDYAADVFDNKEVRGDLWVVEAESEGWNVYRVYDTKTGIMMDASGNYKCDWEALELFE